MSQEVDCPGCGEPVEDGQNQCGICGLIFVASSPLASVLEHHATMQKVQCANCEVWIDEEEQYCIKCRTIEGSPAKTKTPMTTDSAPEREQIDHILQHLCSENYRQKQYEELKNIWRVGGNLEGKYGDYKICGKVGEGGMGIVYEVRQSEWGENFVVKFPKEPQRQKSFEDEVRTWLNIHIHPRLVSPYIVEKFHDIPHLFIEKASGGSLGKYSRNRQNNMAIEEVLVIAIQICECLMVLHEENIIHRDLKPDNLLIDDIYLDEEQHKKVKKLPPGVLGGIDFRYRQIKITDLGLATQKTSAREESKNDIQSYYVAGTLPYMAPEQFIDARNVDEHADIYSLGVILYQMLTGRFPLQVTEHNAENYRHLHFEKVCPIPNVQDLRKDCPTNLAKCVNKALSREKSISNVVEILERLQKVYQEFCGRPYPYQKFETTGRWFADDLNNRALAYLELDANTTAQVFDRALVTDNNHYEAAYNKSLLLWRQGAISSQQLLQKIKSLQENVTHNWKSDYFTGWIHMERGDVESAKQYFIAARERTPQDTGSRSIVENILADETLKHELLAKTIKVRIFRYQDPAAGSVALNEAGTRAVTVHNEDQTLRIWELAEGRCLHICAIKGRHTPVHSIDIDAEGSIAITAGNDSFLRIWDLKKRKVRYTLSGHTGKVNRVVITRDSKIAISAGDDGDLRLWEINTGTCLCTLQGHTGRVNDVCLSADGMQALSASADGTLKLWDLTTGKILRTLQDHGDNVQRITMTIDARFAISVASRQTLQTWDFSQGNQNLHVWDLSQGKFLYVRRPF